MSGTKARSDTRGVSLREGLRQLLALLLRQSRIAVPTLVILIGAELLLRRIAPEYANRVYSRTQTAGHPILMHADGYRGADISYEKPAGTIRILAMGDSVTFGTGVAVDQTWPAQLRGALESSQADPRARVEVLNSGLPATDLAQMALMLETKWLAYQPDAIVVMLSGNVVSLAWIRRDEPVVPPDNPWAGAQPEAASGVLPSLKRLARSFTLPGFATVNVERLTYLVGLNTHNVDPAAPYGAMLAHGWLQADLDPAIAALAWEQTEQQLRALRAAADSLAIPLLVSHAPTRFSLSHRWIDNLKGVPRNRLTIDPVERSKQICARLGIPFVDLRPALRPPLTDLYVLNDYGHFSAEGNARVARALAPALRPLLAP